MTNDLYRCLDCDGNPELTLRDIASHYKGHEIEKLRIVEPNRNPYKNKCEGDCTCSFIHLAGNPHSFCLVCGCMLKDHTPVTKEMLDKL